jgi:outer membrane autotransporter protein
VLPPTTKEAEGKAIAPAPSAPCYGVWASGYGIFGNVSDAGFARGYRFTVGGLLAGVDYRLIDSPAVGLLAVGLFGGYSHTWGDLRPAVLIWIAEGGGIYGTYLNPTGWWVNIGAWGGYNSYDTSRPGLLGNANGSSDGYEVSTFGDAGYDIHLGNLTFGPVVSMQYTTAQVNSFLEHGSLVPLDIHSDAEDSLTTDLGAQATYNWQLGKSVVVPVLRLAWQHEFKQSELPLTVSAPALGGATATVTGPKLGHDSLLIKAGLLYQWNPRISISIMYDGQVARTNYDSHSVTGTFSYSF